MGAGRTLPDLLERYTDTNQTVPITGSLSTLKTWSMMFGWAQRAVEYDAAWEARKNTERERVLAYGLALDYERIRKLYRLANMLEAQIYERGLDGVLHNIWLPDVKQIGNGENAERVDIERFNAPLLEQYRKVLEDIAQETGGRGKNDKLHVTLNWKDELLADIAKKEITTDEQIRFVCGYVESDIAEIYQRAGLQGLALPANVGSISEATITIEHDNE